MQEWYVYCLLIAFTQTFIEVGCSGPGGDAWTTAKYCQKSCFDASFGYGDENEDEIDCSGGLMVASPWESYEMHVFFGSSRSVREATFEEKRTYWWTAICDRWNAIRAAVFGTGHPKFNVQAVNVHQSSTKPSLAYEGTATKSGLRNPPIKNVFIGLSCGADQYGFN